MDFPVHSTASLLPIVGSILNVLVTVLLKKMSNNPLGKMVIHLSIFDLFIAAPAIIENLENFSASSIFSYYTQAMEGFGNSDSMILAGCFAHCLCRVGKEGTDHFLHSQYKIYAKISYAVALILGTNNLITTYVCWYYPKSPRVLKKINPFLIFIQITISFLVSLLFTFEGSSLCTSEEAVYPGFF